MPQIFVSPTGSKIIGTLERLTGVATLSTINDDGTPNYLGKTDIFWDDQETATREGEIIFLDQNGAEWTFGELAPQQNC